jgi:hypothetical protein
MLQRNWVPLEEALVLVASGEARNGARQEGPETMGASASRLGRLELKYPIDERTARVCRQLDA